jgi:hypothetical protein
VAGRLRMVSRPGELPSEVIVYFALAVTDAAENGALGAGAVQVHRESLLVGLEESGSGQRCQLERRAETDARVAVLDPVQRSHADPGALGKIVLSPATLAASFAYLLAEKPDRLQRVLRVSARI